MLQPTCGSRLSALALVMVLALYAGATLPRLGDFPLVYQDEPWIAAPAAELATRGVYGNRLFAGYYGMEQHVYNFPPLFPLTEALIFRWLGVGVWQARFVAVLYSGATMALTYALGRRLYGPAVGAVAAGLLVGLRLAAEPEASGVPLLDLARIARYDSAVPAMVLATLLCFVSAEARHGAPTPSGGAAPAPWWSGWRYLATGLMAGLAILAHVYGGFVLVLIGALLLWRLRWRLLRVPAPYLLATGCGLALAPWGLYLAQHPADYAGQMLPQASRLRVWDPAFVLASLQQEPQRYERLLYAKQTLVLWPRLGIWLALIGLPLAQALLLIRALRPERGSPEPASPLPERLLLLALPTFMLLLGSLINLKFYNYAVILLPFVALNLAFLVAQAWQVASPWPRAIRHAARTGLAALLALTLLEGFAGIGQSLRRAAELPAYQAHADRVAAAIRPGARVLALHELWFGLYKQQYDFRSMVLPFYLANRAYYPLAPLTMEQALERIAPEYMVLDWHLTPLLQLEQPINSLEDEQMRLFRRYMERHDARQVALLSDPSYGWAMVYELTP
jgi:4-amino-4-deoxy-L-arabinose transferase-like glycosyltransferase